jgi:hypothetical protein
LGLVLLAAFAFAGCKKSASTEESASQPAKSATTTTTSAMDSAPAGAGGRTSFQQVTSQLDPGGSLFLYLSTEQWLGQLSSNLAQWKEIASSLPGATMDMRDNVDHGFELVTRLVKNSGLEEVKGVGASAAPVAPGLFRNKFVVHHGTGAGQGFLWFAFGRAPHAQAGFDLLPENTALSVFADVDLSRLWEALGQVARDSGVREAAEMAASFPQMFEKQTKLPWADLLACLSGEVGLVLTLDESQNASLPIGQAQLDLPAPGLLLAVKVNNSLLYDRVSAEVRANPKAVQSEEGDLKICSTPLPGGAPFGMEPTVASLPDYFFVASSPDVVRAVQGVRQGKRPGLKSSPDFQAFRKQLPAEGNQFLYVSRSFGQMFNDVQRQFMNSFGAPRDQMALMQRLLQPMPSASSLVVGTRTPTGWQTTSVGSQDSGPVMVVAPVVGVTAIGAGLLLPALAKAKVKAQTVNSINQLKQLGLAARIYANDHDGRFPSAERWCEELEPVAGSPKVFKAPNDGGPGRCSYAYNEKLSGRNEAKIPPETVLFFEADGDWNTHGGPELLLKQPRTPGIYVIGFADGSVQQVAPARLSSLRWEP